MFGPSTHLGVCFQEAFRCSGDVLDHEERVFRFLLRGVADDDSILYYRLHALMGETRTVADAVEVPAHGPELGLKVQMVIPDAGDFIAAPTKHAVATTAKAADLSKVGPSLLGPFFQALFHHLEAAKLPPITAAGVFY